MNLLKFSYRPLYYIKRPWRLFQELYYKCKNAWSRVTKGYSWYDSADMDNFLLHIIPGMLRDIANSNSHPAFEPFNTHEKWQDYCNSLADVFESLQQENWTEGRNEWEEEFMKVMEVRRSKNDITSEQKEICELYFEREKELWVERKKLLKDAFSNLAEYFDDLWI